MDRTRTLLLVVLALAVLAATPSAAPAASGDATQAAALKKCKKGLNAKKCKCKKGYSLKKSGSKYKCVKKKAPPTQTPTTDPSGTGTGTGGGGTGTGTGEGASQPPTVRDDAGFTAALSNSLLLKREEGSYGYGRYAYNFLPSGGFLFCSYYYAGSTVESNSGGSWQVLEGHRSNADANYFGGAVQVTLSDGKVQNFGVEVRGNQGYVVLPQGQSSSYWTTGTFSRSQPATDNCSQIQ